MIARLAPVLALLPAVAAADVDGLWRTEPRSNGAYITVLIGPCEEQPRQRCGTIEGVHGGARPDIVGDPILQGLEPDGPGHWSEGKIIRPGEGTVYRSEMTVDGDRLEVEGCAVGGLFCGGQTWTRVRQSE